LFGGKKTTSGNTSRDVSLEIEVQWSKTTRVQINVQKLPFLRSFIQNRSVQKILAQLQTTASFNSYLYGYESLNK
jgi:hypothetical protein